MPCRVPPVGKREIAIAGRRVQGIVPAPEPNHAIRAVIDEAIRGAGGRRVEGHSVQPLRTRALRHAGLPRLPGGPPSGDRVRGSGAGRRSDQPPGDPGPGIAPLRTGWIPDGDAEGSRGGAVMPSLAGCSHRRCCSARPHRRRPCGPRHFRRSRPLFMRLHKRAPAPAVVDTS